MMTRAAIRNMRFAFETRANPKKHAATMLITSPRNVSTFGEIFVSARPFTIFCSNHPLPFPKALVQVIELRSSKLRSLLRRRRYCSYLLVGRNIRVRNLFFHLIVDGDQLQHFKLAFSVWRVYRRHIANLLAQQRAPCLLYT